MRKNNRSKKAYPAVLVTNRQGRGGFAFAKLLGVLILLGVVGGGAWGARHYLNKEKEKVRKEVYHVAKKADFLVTVPLTGQLKSTDVEELKCELEGQTTIETIVEEGTKVKGPVTYTVKLEDTIESISKYHDKDLLCIKQLNKDLKLDWEKLEAGTEIQIPGDLLVELDPLSLKERINTQEIAVQRSENNLMRARGNKETLVLASELALKVAQNNYTNAVMDLDKLKNNTIETFITNTGITIKNLETDVELAEKSLTAYNRLKELGFVSDLAVLTEKSKRDKALHRIKELRDDLEAYKKYDQKSLLSAKELKVDECKVQIEKTKVINKANAADAASDVLTAEKTLELEQEKLEDLFEQMANTKIYAPQDGTVLYWTSRYDRGEPVMEGAKIWKGRNIIKLPKTKSLMVDISVPQLKRPQLKVGQRAYIEVEGIKLPGTLSMISTTVDSNRRGHTDKSYFKAEVAIDSSNFPDSVSEGMKVKVEVVVMNLVEEERLIKLPNQCVTTRMISEDTPETGCWVLNEKTEKHEWRPVTIAYSDETHIAIRDWASILDITDKQKDKWWQERIKAKDALDQLAEKLAAEKETLMVKIREEVKDYSIADRQEAIKTAKQETDQAIRKKQEIEAAKIISDFRKSAEGFLSEKQLVKFDEAPSQLKREGNKTEGIMVYFDGLREGERIHLSPLTEAENLNLDEAIMGKGYIDLETPAPKKTDSDDPVSLLGITDDQKQQWVAAQSKVKVAADKLKAGIMSQSIPREQIQNAFAKVRDDFRVEVQKFLTEEQMQKFDGQMKEDYKVLLPKE